MDKLIKLEPFSVKGLKIVEDGADYLYIHPTHLRIIGRGTAEDTMDDPKVPLIKIWDFDITLPKQHITSFNMGYAPVKDCYILTIESGGQPTDLAVPDRHHGKDLLNKLLLWYFNPEEYYK